MLERGLGLEAAADRLSGWDPQHWPVASDWHPVIGRFLASPSAQRLEFFIRNRLAAGAIIYPPQPFRALELTPLARVKVVILGQDPYHGPGQAQGLAFSVAAGVKVPPSLRNILAEIDRDRNVEKWPDSESAHSRDHRSDSGMGNLTAWARQGVLLLNTCLTVEHGQPGSHAHHGWEALTDDIIKAVAQQGGSVAFMFWGSQAQAKQGLVDIAPSTAHFLTLTANHPSPLSARRLPKPFVGCGHFGLANAFLRQHGEDPVRW